MEFLIVLTIGLALLFDFLNGMNDAANSIATIVSTKVLSPRGAVLRAAFFNFTAFLFFGLKVAGTIGKWIVDPTIITQYMIFAAVVGAIIRVAVCTYAGLPISVSHSLIGGLIGGGLMVGWRDVLLMAGITKVALSIVLSPLIGMLVAYTMMIITLWIARLFQPSKLDTTFRVMQLLSSAAYSLGHGSNDAQKTMGIIAVLLFSTGYLGSTFYVPLWVVLSCHSAIALGTMLGWWKVVKTLWVGITDLKPMGWFCAETASAMTLFGTALAWIPVSTTHTITGAVIGVGMTKRLSAVRWTVANHIVWAWILTIPAAALMSAGIYWIIA